MKCLALDNYHDFECIGSACPSTCCAVGWTILVDADSAAFYESVPGEFGDKLRNNLIHKDNVCYIQMDHDRCPFLTEENLCDIYRNLGKDKMCNTCTCYPRFQQFYGDIAFQGLSLSCPEVAKNLFLRTDSLGFDFAEVPDTPALQENICDTEDWDFFNICIDAMTTGTAILQNRAMALNTRLQLFLLLASQVQTALDNHKDTAPVLDLFSDAVRLDTLAKEFSGSRANRVNAHVTLLIHWYKHLSALQNYEFLAPHFSPFASYVNERGGSLDIDELNTLFSMHASKERQIQHEQYCLYFLFRHFMKCYKERNLYKYAALIVYLYCLQFDLEVFLANSQQGSLSLDHQVAIANGIAKCFEHATQNNMNTLYQLFHDADMTDLDLLLTLLS